MTAKEAIGVIEAALSFVFDDVSEKQNWDDAITTAISALKRMAPEHPLLEENHDKLGYAFVCPHCHRMSTFSLHCRFCGQKIDMSGFDTL